MGVMDELGAWITEKHIFWSFSHLHPTPPEWNNTKAFKKSRNTGFRNSLIQDCIRYVIKESIVLEEMDCFKSS